MAERRSEQDIKNNYINNNYTIFLWIPALSRVEDRPHFTNLIRFLAKEERRQKEIQIQHMIPFYLDKKNLLVLRVQRDGLFSFRLFFGNRDWLRNLNLMPISTEFRCTRAADEFSALQFFPPKKIRLIY